MASLLPAHKLNCFTFTIWTSCPRRHYPALNVEQSGLAAAKVAIQMALERLQEEFPRFDITGLELLQSVQGCLKEIPGICRCAYPGMRVVLVCEIDANP